MTMTNAIVGSMPEKVDLTNHDDPTGYGHPVVLVIRKRNHDGTLTGPFKSLSGWTDLQIGDHVDVVLDTQNGYRTLSWYGYEVVGRISEGMADLPEGCPKRVSGYHFD